MAITIVGLDGNPFGARDVDATPNNFIYTTHRLLFTGAYTAGGDTLDFTNGGVNSILALVPSATGVAGTLGTGPIGAFAEGNAPIAQAAVAQSAIGGYYVVLAGTTASNWRVKIFAAGGSELGAGAYGAAILNDLVYLYVQWRKLL